VANRLILSAGWRMAYLVLASPMILVAVPLVALAVRSRPPGSVKTTIAQGAEYLEGFETAEAVRTRSFWMLVVAHFCFWFNAAGLIHLIAFLEGLGYSASTAALAYSALLGLGGVGKIAAGHIADRVSARLALAASFVWLALALTIVFYVAHALLLETFILVFGIACATPVVLLPLLLAESLGRRRYGMLGALIGIAGTLGAAAGPVVAGRIFDLLGSYRGAFELFILLEAIGAVVTLACRPYNPRAQVSIAPIAARA
jgi:MFS family permease